MSYRRDQILRGIAVPPERAASGLSDRRRHPRSAPFFGMGRPTVGLWPAVTKNASSSGLAVLAETDLGVGDSVPVKFAGHPTLGGRIVWKRGPLMGLELALGRSVQG
jgi:protein involved in polysaccharide export with SLBB domain